MLGMMQGKGGEQTNQPIQQPMGGGMGNLAALFGNAGQMPSGGGMPAPAPLMPMPQITQPQRPTIAPPMARPIPQAPLAQPPAALANAIRDMRGNIVPQSQDYHKMSPVRQARHRAGGR